MAVNIQPVLLCGGSGTRLWPLSREGFPKQFLCLISEQSLFQQSVLRLTTLRGQFAPGEELLAPQIVCGEEHRFLVTEQLREIGVDPAAILLEPAGRNTAPALTMACMAARLEGDDPVLIVTPADQTISNQTAFSEAILVAITEAEKNNIVLLGLTPDRAETGYGYIQVEKHDSIDQNLENHLLQMIPVLRFVEKPDLYTAQSYLEETGYFWNAGIFVLKASVWLSSLLKFRPDIYQATRLAWEQREVDAKFTRPGKSEFFSIPGESIDYAVMEPITSAPSNQDSQTQLASVFMLPFSSVWNDLGSWDAVWQCLPRDANNNAKHGDVLIKDCKNTLAHANYRILSLVGVEDLIVVETADAVLVTQRYRSQVVKNIVGELQTNGRSEHITHRKVHRPWGWYDCLDEGDRFKVKRIQVNPGASLSLQRHNHRAEHWVVVRGIAEICSGDKTTLLNENQSAYIPIGETHRVANPGITPLEIIEVQSGSYLDEDDIERLHDDFGRI